jgi:hypothetical protein
MCTVVSRRRSICTAGASLPRGKPRQRPRALPLHLSQAPCRGSTMMLWRSPLTVSGWISARTACGRT